MLACINGDLKKAIVRWKEDLYCVGVILASKGYPGSYVKGMAITGNSLITSPTRDTFQMGV